MENTKTINPAQSRNVNSCKEISAIPFWASQSACYTENGQYIICYPSSFEDILLLRCYDRGKNSFIWKKLIKGCGHANSICFRPSDRKLYIANCTNAGQTANIISVIELDNIEKGVIDVIQSPARGGICSIAYDRENDTFYSTNYVGINEGDANILFSYNGIFDSVKEETVLDDLTVRSETHYLSQGVQLVINGIAYIPYYKPSQIIAGFDLKTGERVVTSRIPVEIDGHDIIELEGITYDYETQSFIIVDAFGFIESRTLFNDYAYVVEIPFCWAMSGCYIEDGKYVIAYTSSDGSALILRCYDADKSSTIWTKEINEIRYANSICFRKQDRFLYLADCYTYADSSDISNRICVLDYDNIDKGVIKIIQSPARGGIYSIGYDEDNDIFYSTNYIGRNEGEANVLFSYNGIFESIKSEILIDDLSYRKEPLFQTMGVQCIVGGVAYYLYSSPFFLVAGYDVSTGAKIFSYLIPEISIEGKLVIRPESILYNSDLNKVYIQTATAILECLDK